MPATQEMPLLLLSARVSARVPRAQKSWSPGVPCPAPPAAGPLALDPPQTRPPILGSRGNGPVPEAGLTFCLCPRDKGSREPSSGALPAAGTPMGAGLLAMGMPAGALLAGARTPSGVGPSVNNSGTAFCPSLGLCPGLRKEEAPRGHGPRGS